MGFTHLEVLLDVLLFLDLDWLYSFFSASPLRWKMLKDAGITVKRPATTRWSAPLDAVCAVKTNLEQILSILDTMAVPDEDDTSDGRKNLLNTIGNFSFISWHSGVLCWRMSIKHKNTYKHLDSA